MNLNVRCVKMKKRIHKPNCQCASCLCKRGEYDYSEERSQNISKALKKKYANGWITMKGKKASEETKRKMSEALMGREHSQHTRKKMSEASKGVPKSEAHKNALSLARKGRTVEDLGHDTKTCMCIACRYKRGDYTPTEETEQKRLKVMRDPKTRKKISDALIDWNFYYEHGTTRSKYPYPPEFNESLRKSIATRDFYTCQLCGELLPEYWGTHHIDYNKDNCSEINLIFLCQYCHSKTNANRPFWQQYFENLQYERFKEET